MLQAVSRAGSTLVDKRLVLLFCSLLLTSCVTRTWEETPGEFRVVGPTKEYREKQVGAHHFLRFETDVLPDGYQFFEEASTDAGGKAKIDLLPIAIVVLRYSRDIELRIFRHDDERVIGTQLVSREQAEDVINKRATRVKLGGKVKLRKAILAMLDDLSQSQSGPLTDSIKILRVHAELRREWE